MYAKHYVRDALVLCCKDETEIMIIDNFHLKNVIENVVCKMVAILFRPYYTNIWNGALVILICKRYMPSLAVLRALSFMVSLGSRLLKKTPPQIPYSLTRIF